MSEDIKVTDGTILESLNGKVDLDGGNYRGSGLENRVKNSLLNKVLFDTKLSDHVLSFEESRGWALQGTYVYKEAVASSRYGYPDFYNKCVEEKDLGVATETVLGENTITLYTNANGHTFYDIADKEAIDAWYNTYGIAWYYGVDTEGERIFLPRTKWFIQPSGEITEVNTVNEAGLPNITGITSYRSDLASGAFGKYQGTAYGLSTSSSTPNCINFDASLSNPVYGNSTTVQPPSINQLLYICVGNVTADVSHIDVVTQVENGVKDIDDAVNNGVSRLNSIDSLKYNNITNCLLEVPQRVKLELNNGVLTLKAGSQVIVPNGFEDDGVTPRFDYVDVESDLILTRTWGTAEPVYIFFNLVDSGISMGGTTRFSSGTTAPTLTNAQWWYDTTTNLIKRYSSASDSGDRISFPIAICTKSESVENSVIASINQVFNGLGYMGSTVWVDKGVKGLIPNGRNEDGSLKNIEFTTDKILMQTQPNATANIDLYLSKTEVFRSTVIYYNDKLNLNISSNDGTNVGAVLIGNCTLTNGVISNFNPKQPFRAVDWNDGIRITETYVNGSSWYRVYSDGWCEQGGKWTGSVSIDAGAEKVVTITFLKPYKDINYHAVSETITNHCLPFRQVPEKDKIGFSFGAYQVARTLSKFTWEAKGYIA